MEKSDERKWKLLYHRDPSRSKSPRALLGVSTFNMVYWTWYCADFTPAINSSAHEKAALGQIGPETLDLLLVDPTMGYVGLGISTVIWLGAFVYTRQLVSAIWGSQPTSSSAGGEEIMLAVSTLKFPFLNQLKILGRTVYDPENNDFGGKENIVFTESELRSEPTLETFAPGELALSEDNRKHDAVVRFDGEFGRLRGHIALKKEDGGGETNGLVASLLQSKYLLDIHSEEEVMRDASPTLLHSLVIRDDTLAGGWRGQGRHDDSEETGSADHGVVKERKTTSRPIAERRRHVTQLEMARGTRNKSIRGQKGHQKKR